MRSIRALFLLALLATAGGPVWSQDPAPEPEEEEACGCGDEASDDEDDGEDDDDDGEIEISIGGEGSDDGRIDLVVDPYARASREAGRNQPPPIVVGEHEPPPLTRAAQDEVRRLLAVRGENLESPGPLYPLAEFYMKHRWLPHAERALLDAARLDPKSVRPWESLLRLYAIKAKRETREELIRRVMAQGGNLNFADLEAERTNDWLMPHQRVDRIVRAYEEILKLRPDDLARRRELIIVLRDERRDASLHKHARAVLERVPDDPDTRFELAESVRRLAEDATREACWEKHRAKGTKPDAYELAELKHSVDYAESVALLEENLKRAPTHVPSLLRLARIVAVRDGSKAEARIGELERRAVFEMFLRRGIGTVPLRDDTFRMVRDLIGSGVAGRLWDAVMIPEWYRQRREGRVFVNPDTIRATRWAVVYFPHADVTRRLEVIERLGRRADRGSATILLAYLWHLAGPGLFDDGVVDRKLPDEVRLEDAAVKAVARLGAAALPLVRAFFEQVERDAAGVTSRIEVDRWSGESRFANAAIRHDRKRRAVKLLAAVAQRGCVAPLLRALDWDRSKEAGLHVAVALEKIGDARAVGGLVDAALDAGRPLDRRREAAEALAAFRDPRSISAITTLRTQPDFEFVTAYAAFRLAGDDAGLARLARGVAGEDDAERIFALLEKCDDPKVGRMLAGRLPDLPEDRAALAIDHLRRRYWKQNRDAVRKYLIAGLQRPSVPDSVIALVSEFPEAEVAAKLLTRLENCSPAEWPAFARALATTGDARAVRYFNRMRVLGKERGKRRLARELHTEAARRLAARKRAGSR